jgi:glutaredoxin 3
MSKKFTVYYSPFCPYCTMAFRLLEQLEQEYNSINLMEYPEKRSEMESRSQRTSVPQIFLGDIHIGGYDDMNAMNQNGKLAELID